MLVAGLMACAPAASAGSSVPAAEILLSRNGGYCGGHCALHLYGGRDTPTNMTAMFALDSAASFKPDEFRPVWDWDYGRSGLVAGAVSRRLVRLLGVLDVEAEAGVGQRFGRMSEAEVWSALFFRWTWFPWNSYVKTTLAASTGLNYATGLPVDERMRDSEGRSSRLLHFFSPEITISLPSQPQWELVARLHHRSGGRILFGEVPLFNGVDGGAQFATLGLRYRF